MSSARDEEERKQPRDRRERTSVEAEHLVDNHATSRTVRDQAEQEKRLTQFIQG